MLTHEKLWTAIDQLANSNGYSASGLAKKAGLDPTSFNKSKRKARDGKPRWPSTESISKVLAATGASMGEFITLMGEELPEGMSISQAEGMPEPEIKTEYVEVEKIREVEKIVEVPVEVEVRVPAEAATRDIPLVQDDTASDPSIFGESGYPQGKMSSYFTLPDGQPELSNTAWAMEITTSTFAPYYQEGDILLIDPNGPARAGDPFLIRRKSGGQLALYRGQSANPVIGEPLGRIMGVFYSMVENNNEQDIAA